MARRKSKVTSQEGDKVVARKSGNYTFEDIHRALFPNKPKRRTVEEMDEGIRQYMKAKHPRR